MNEIVVTVQDAIISIEEREKVEQQVNEIAKKFKNYLPSADTLPADRATRAELRKVTKGLDDKRKEIKKDFNKPLSEFEGWVKKASKPLIDAIDAIDKGIKEIEENERQIRISVIDVAFKEKAKLAGLDYRLFVEKYDNYNKATNFNQHKQLKKGVLDDIETVIDYELQKQQGRKNDISSISEIALERSLTAEPYIRELDNGKGLNEILQDMLRDAKAQDEARAKREAEQAKREAEQAKRDAEMAQRAANFQTQQLETSFNVSAEATETTHAHTNVTDEQIDQGHVKTSPEPSREPEQANKPLKRLTLEIIIDESNPLTPFRPFLDENGYTYKIIGYEEIK